ncbi:MAG: hypothetical protein OXE59_05175 [Bacteroidetes bacterium]|nr:hypothetical protein [Bacteroidota bacterium]MCY4233116.1 hypothetical protein [Bacteroidota bacterium]
MVDIVLIILASLVAVAVVPEFDIDLPVSQEISESGLILRPLQISIDENGEIYYLDSSNEQQLLPPDRLFGLAQTIQPNQIVEIHADESAPAFLLLSVNRVIQNAGRNATFLVNSN